MHEMRNSFLGQRKRPFKGMHAPKNVFGRGGVMVLHGGVHRPLSRRQALPLSHR